MGKMSLIIVIGFNIIFMLMGFNLSGIASHSYSNYTNYYNVEQAQFLAESAANVSIGSLYQNSGWLFNDSTVHLHNLEGGTYSIQAKRSYPSGAAYVTFNIVSAYNGMTDTTTVVCNIPSFSSFAMYTCNDGSSPWTGGDTCWGKLHADSVLNIGTLNGSSAVFNGSVSVGVKIDSSGLSGGTHPQFKQGAPTMGVKLGWVNDFNSVRSASSYQNYDSSDFITPKYTKNGKPYQADIFVQMNSDGTVEIDTGAYNKSATLLIDSSWYKAKKINKATISTLSSIGVIGIMDPSSNANIHVRGTLNGKLTIANIGKGNIYIDSNVVYKDTTTDLLGLVAADTMFVAYDSANVRGPVKIQAAILAQTFTAQNPNTNWGTGAPLNAAKQSIQLFGALAQRNRGPVGNGNAGYAKSYKYDNRFAGGSNSAPSYPTLPYFQILSWYDRMAWNTSWWSNW